MRAEMEVLVGQREVGGLAVAAGETSVGGQKSCHPQIIRKI